mmetsp:Transcript_31146/g.61414  ORF Transcript_31146/g.61414 Transcript_31146/m.61414 type:complete len:185 (+) Transcript_31146:283-837(+)
MEEGLRREQQKEVGAFGWASKTQPHLLFLFSHMSRMNGKPTKRTLRAVRRALWHAFSHARPLRLVPVKGKPCLVVWVDASYETRQKQGRLGYEFQIVEERDLKDLSILGEENTVAWRSKRYDRKLASMTGAELLAMRDGVKQAFLHARLISRLWGASPKVVVVSDSQPLLRQLTSRQCTADPQL